MLTGRWSGLHRTVLDAFQPLHIRRRCALLAGFRQVPQLLISSSHGSRLPETAGPDNADKLSTSRQYELMVISTKEGRRC